MLDTVVIDLDSETDLLHDLRHAGQNALLDGVEAMVGVDSALDVDLDLR